METALELSELDQSRLQESLDLKQLCLKDVKLDTWIGKVSRDLGQMQAYGTSSDRYLVDIGQLLYYSYSVLVLQHSNAT